jgi:hypothetical protein
LKGIGLNTGEGYQITFDVFDSGPFRTTLVWTDYQGTEASHGALVNDPDLVVEAPGGTLYLGNEVLAGGRDETNNVEGVDLMPLTGTYTVTVSGFNGRKVPNHLRWSSRPISLACCRSSLPTTLPAPLTWLIGL